MHLGRLHCSDLSATGPANAAPIVLSLTLIVGFELNSSNNFSNRNINFSQCFCCLLEILVQTALYMPKIPLINYKIKI